MSGNVNIKSKYIKKVRDFMANICLYKILIKGSKAACYAFIDMMPSYNADKEILREEGTDSEYELVLKGDCKWSVSAYTENIENPQPLTAEEINNIEDGDHWDKTIKDKSVLLDCEIFCNSKDIDEPTWATYEHYKNGIEIKDECPKELHIKRGRDYDESGTVVMNINAPDKQKNLDYGRVCRIQFGSGYNYYQGPFEVGDIIRSSGKQTGTLGRITAIEDDAFLHGRHKIYQIVGHADPFIEDEIEAIWKSFKPKERKAWLSKIVNDDAMTKVKFLRVINHQWTLYAFKNNNWEQFKTDLSEGTFVYDLGKPV